jgi:TPR repeat protein
MAAKAISVMAFWLPFSVGNTAEPCFDESAAFESHFSDCRIKANQGDALAQYNLGFMYEDGHGVTKNPRKAIYWYAQAAEQNDISAQLNLAWFYFSGFEEKIPRHEMKAVYWYTRAARQGSQRAQYMLGWMYHEGTGTLSPNYEKALHWYTRAASQGDPRAQIALGLLYYEGGKVPADYEKAILFLNMAKTNGIEEAAELKKLAEKKRDVAPSATEEPSG